MTPGELLQRILADVPGYDAAELVRLLPLSAALQSAIYARILVLSHQAALPDTDYFLNIDQTSQRLGKSDRWIRDNISTLPFARKLGSEYRFSARGLDEWIENDPRVRIPTALPPKRRHHER